MFPLTSIFSQVHLQIKALPELSSQSWDLYSYDARLTPFDDSTQYFFQRIDRDSGLLIYSIKPLPL